MSYGFEFYNNNNELVIDDTYTKPWFIGKGTYTGVEVSTDYTIPGYTVYKLTYSTPTSGPSGGAVYINWPPNNISNIAYCLEQTVYAQGQNVIVYAAVSTNYSPINADVPQVFCFSLDFITNISSGWGAKIFDPSGNCVFNADTRHLKIDTASDTVGIWGGSSALASSPNATQDPSTAQTRSNFAPSVEYPAFFTPRLSSEELVNNGDGTFTRNTYLTFYGRYNVVTAAWQPKVRSQTSSGTLPFSGSRFFNNKNYYDYLVAVSNPPLCYATPLVIDYSSYDPVGITVNWPQASYSIVLTNALDGTNTVNEGFGLITGTVTVTNITPGTTLRYIFSGTNITASDFVSGSLEGTFVVGNNSQGSFSVGISNDSLFEGTEIAVCSITRTNGNAITGSPASITITEGPPGYYVSVNYSSVNEGGSFTITCQSSKQNADGQVQTVPYTLSQPSGTAFDANDWTGTVTLGSGATVPANNFVFANGSNYASRTFYPAADLRTDGTKVLRLTIDNYSSTYNSVDVTINDTSLDYTWSLSGPTTVNEGSTYTYTVTTNAPSGSTALIGLGAPNTADQSDIETVNGITVTTGNTYRVSTTNGTGSFAVKYKADQLTEGSEYFTMFLDKDDTPYSHTRLTTLSSVITINDTSLTPESWVITATSGNPTTTNVREGTSLGVNIASSNVVSYPKTLYYKFTGTGLTQSDIYDGTVALSGVTSITSNSLDTTVPIQEDYLLEANETITLQFYSDSGYTTPVGNSLTWTIHDTLQLSRSTAYVTEGYAESITINSYGLTYPTTVYGRITGAGITDAMITGNSKDVQFLLSSQGALNFTIGATANFVVDGVRTATLTIYSDAGRTVQMGNTITWDIHDNSTSTTAISGSPSTSSINEGNTLTYSITTDAVLPRYFYGNITGSGITASDFTSGSTSVTNYVTYSGQQFTITMTADSLTEGAETATLNMYYDSGLTQPAGNAISWTINDTSTTPVPVYTFTRTPASGNINEGSIITIGWSFVNVPLPITLYYQLTGAGVTANDTGLATLQGPFSTSTASGSIDLPITADHLTEGTETVTITWYINSNYTGQVGNSITFSINDTSVNYPAYGTYNTSYCTGYTLTTVYNDGSGGTYNTTTANSPTCGWTPVTLSSMSASGGNNGATYYINAYLNRAADVAVTVSVYYSLTGYTQDTFVGTISIAAGASSGSISGTVNTYSGVIYLSGQLSGTSTWKYTSMRFN